MSESDHRMREKKNTIWSGGWCKGVRMFGDLQRFLFAGVVISLKQVFL